MLLYGSCVRATWISSVPEKSGSAIRRPPYNASGRPLPVAADAMSNGATSVCARAMPGRRRDPDHPTRALRAGADVDGQRVAHAPPRRERSERPDPRVVAELVHHAALGGDRGRLHRVRTRAASALRCADGRARSPSSRRRATSSRSLGRASNDTGKRRTGRTPPSLSDCRNGKAPPACVAESVASTREARRLERAREAGAGLAARLRGRGWSCRRRALRADAGRRAPRRARWRRRAASATPGPGCTRDRSRGRHPRSSAERSGARDAPASRARPRALRIAAMAERSLSTSGPPASSARYFVSIGQVGVDAEIVLRARERRRGGDRRGGAQVVHEHDGLRASRRARRRGGTRPG